MDFYVNAESETAICVTAASTAGYQRLGYHDLERALPQRCREAAFECLLPMAARRASNSSALFSLRKLPRSECFMLIHRISRSLIGIHIACGLHRE